MSIAKSIETYEEFVNCHGLLLAASGLPQSLYKQLFQKLTSETFDGGAYFQIEPCEDGRQRRLVLTTEFMDKESDVFLIDHAWTFRLDDCYKQLKEIPGLAERMAALMCLDNDDLSLDPEENGNIDNGDIKKENRKPNVEKMLETEVKDKGSILRWLELEELDIDDDMLVSLDLSARFPDLLALSLCSNKLENLKVVADEVTKFKHLRALWVNDNPLLKNCELLELENAIANGLPELQIINSKFTRRFDEWALGLCGGIYGRFCGGILCGKDNPGINYQDDLELQKLSSLDLSNRGIHNLVNKAFSPSKFPAISYLNLRGNLLEENSAGDLLKLLKEFLHLHSLEVDIPGPLGESALEIVDSLPKLSELNGVSVSKILETRQHVVDSWLQPHLPEWNPEEPLVDRITSAMFQFLMTYRLADEEKIDETSVWYVMDELGSALRHSDEPNFRVVPFLYMPEGNLASAISFSILWPAQNVHKDDECTRDFLSGIGEDKQRSARLTAWFHTPENYFIQEYEKYIQNLKSPRSISSPAQSCATESSRQLKGNPLHVYTDIPQVEEFLTHPEFTITTDPKEADIIWTSVQIDEDMKKATGITDQQYVNQYPFEACLVMKHHLADTVQKAHGCPAWLQPTYNLETHLSQLIGDYLVRKRDGLNNLWILKPWNMARTIDTTVTDNISAIIRLMETGPKICQKYIEHPALFKGRKFDLRYIVLIRSMNPLEIFLTDVFWVRLANNPYSLEKKSLFEYETHFTVMNYRGTLSNNNTADFVREFEQEHHVKWLDIHSRVRSMIRSVFEAAAVTHPEMHSPKSRAMYGIDVMVDRSFHPKLLEVTYCPDCTRACKYDTEAVVGEGGIVEGRDFFNNVFSCLFLNEANRASQL